MSLVRRPSSAPTALAALLAMSCIAIIVPPLAAAQTTVLEVGDTAPEFPSPLPSSAGEKAGEVKLALKDVLGKKNIVLAFYVADWTGG